MVLVLNGPMWFRGIDTIFFFVSGLITLLIAMLSYKAYKLSGDPKYKFFTLAFGLISAAFVYYALFITLLLTHVSRTLTNLVGQFDFVFLGQIFLTILALMILTIVTLKVTQQKVQMLLLALALLFALFSYQHFLKFHLISFLLLFILSHQFYTNYLEKKSTNAKLVSVAFYILAVAEALYIAFVYSNEFFYVAATVVQLIGYLVLFAVLLRIVYHDREKRKA